MTTDLLQENIGEGIPIGLCVSVGSAIGVFGAYEPAGKWIRAGERRSFSSCGRAVSGGIWYTRATKEDGAGGRAVSRGKWCAADDGEERRKKKRWQYWVRLI